LAASLPEELLASSERWAARFLGKQKSLRSYVVRTDRLVVPETLTSASVCYFGERIELTEEQARELLREDGGAGTFHLRRSACAGRLEAGRRDLRNGSRIRIEMGSWRDRE